MVQWIVLVPLVLPVAWAALAPVIARRFAPTALYWVTIALIPLELLLWLVNLLPFEHRLVISSWGDGAFEVALNLDGVAFVLVFVLYLLMGALWLIVPTSARLDLTTSLVLLAASVLALAANVPTIYLAWILLDATMFAWRLAHDIETGQALRSLISSQIGAVMLFAGAQFLGTDVAARGILLIGLAYWARMGIFPFHWVYPLRGLDSRDLWYSRAVPLIAASSLWLRWPAFGAQAPGQILAIIGLVAIVGDVVWMWHEEQPARAGIFGVWHAVPFVPLAVSYGGDSGSILGFWITLSLVFALVFFEVGLRWRAQKQNYWIRVFWLAAVACLAGVPITPAFAGRVGMYAFFIESGNTWLVIVLTVLIALVVAILARYAVALDGAEPRGLTGPERSGIVLVLVVFAILTLGAYVTALGLGDPLSASAESFVAFSAEKPAYLISALVALLIPIAIAYGLVRAGRLGSGHPAQSLSGVARALELDWLEHLATGLGYRTGVIVRSLATIAEENPTVWILLVALWIAILTVLPR